MDAIIRGYDNKEETQDYINKVIKNTKIDNMYINRAISKPTYDEMIDYNKVITLPFFLGLKAITDDVNNWLDITDGEKIATIIEDLLQEGRSSGISGSILKNLYIRMLIALKSKFKELLVEKGNMVYIGVPDKYEFVILSMFLSLGANILIVNLQSEDIEFIVKNKFKLKDGEIKDDLNYVILTEEEKLASKPYINILGPDAFDSCGGKHPKECLKILNRNITDRHKDEMWNVYHLEMVGVIDEEYNQVPNLVIKEAKAHSRNYTMLENKIDNPNYEENKSFDSIHNISTVKVKDILKYKALVDIAPSLELRLKQLLDNQNFAIENKKDNYKKVMLIWLTRFLHLFDKIDSQGVPILVLWGRFSRREEEFISLISLLPIDIVHFAPNRDNILTLFEHACKITIGNSSTEYTSFPEDILPRKVATVAFKAERDLDTILYGGDSGSYRANQFKNVEAVTLKTTYDEILILWNQQSKFRPSFESIGSLVKIGTIFAKINGIPFNNKDEYINNIQRFTSDNTIFHQRLPFSNEPTDDWKNFVRQVIYRDTVDFDKIKQSKYYKYGVYSRETQELIIQKTKDLIKIDWCNSDVRNIIYSIVEVVFSLPNDIVQMIHGYDFTGDVPKLVIFSGGTEVCNLEDCITIMFLKLIGFDVLVLSPTGYQTIENYINPSLYNTIVGSYDFDLDNYDFSKKGSKESFFKNIFNTIGGK